MKFSEQWLREWVDPDIDRERLCEQLTMAGLEVDAVEPVAPSFSGVVVGEIVSAERHPDADKLQICRVDVAQPEPLSIVCGAANARAGIKVPVALVGAVLPGDFKIKEARLRGVLSAGMLCSARELGLAEEADGLLELPDDAEPGRDLRDYLRLDDVTIELGLTPNRGDCLSVMGVAREVAAINDLPLRIPPTEPVAATDDTGLPVRIVAGEACPRYVGRVIRNIDPAARTPVWMEERLRRSGVRPLGAVVDVTNYVMLELGQPMHAFDLDKLNGEIQVRRARAGEALRLLDGQQVALREGSLVIADEEAPVALAGIMGGAGSAVGEETRNIFLESAFFTPEAMAGQARSYGLHTDSSHRFERGVDPALQERAIERATTLLLAIAGGDPGPVTEVSLSRYLPRAPHVPLREARISRLLGSEFSAGEVTGILSKLGMTVEPDEKGWRVVPPSYRFDIAIEADLIEELARIRGYDRLPGIRPEGRLAMQPCPESRLPLEALRRLLTARGYQEVITYSFVDPALEKLLNPEQEPLALANPIASDMAVMRTTLWSGLLPVVAYNLNRQHARVRVFETGLRFVPSADGVRQEKVLAGAICGLAEPEQWGESAREVDFFDLKGDVEALLAPLPLRFRRAEHPALHPGQSARIHLREEPVGWLGLLHPSIEQRLELSRPVMLFELRLNGVLERPVPRFREFSRYPAIRRDLAIIVDEAVEAEAVLSCIRESAGELLQDICLFDVYQGKGIDPGRKSLALGLTLQHYSRTLEDREVDDLIHRVVDAIEQRLGGTLRD